MKSVHLIADIGGTNARFSLVDAVQGQHEYASTQCLQCSDFKNIDDAINHYLESHSEFVVEAACLAAAAYISNDGRVELTNNHWKFDPKELKEQLGLKALYVVNDFEAIAHSIAALSDEHTRAISNHKTLKIAGGNQSYAIVGPGTGLGVANLRLNGASAQVVTSEAGHLAFAPETELELEVFQHLRQRFPRLHYERLLSGSGLVNLYEAISVIEGLDPKNLGANDICQLAIDQQDDICLSTFNVFCSVLGAFAGESVLMFNATSGVYIAGGILPRYPSFLENSYFMERFTNKGHYSDLLKQVPVKLITHKYPGLLGCAAFLNR